MIRFTGFASRFYFYPENFAIPEEQNKDYFGELKRQVQPTAVLDLGFPFHSPRMPRSYFFPTRRMETAPTCSESGEMTSLFCP